MNPCRRRLLTGLALAPAARARSAGRAFEREDRTAFRLAGDAPRATLPFELVDNRLFVQAMVNDRGPFRFVFDTGGSHIVDTELALALGLPLRDGFAMPGAGDGTLPAWRTHVARAEVGPVQMRGLPFVAMSLHGLRRHIGFERLDGLIGHEVMRRFVVEADFAASHCRLAEPDAAPEPPQGAAVLPLDFTGTVPVVQGHIDGRAARIAVDSGDRSSLTLFTPFVEAHDLRSVYARRFSALTGWGVGGPLHADVTRVQTLGLGPLSLGGVTARMPTGRGGVFASREVQASVGTGVLRHLHVGFDYGRRRMWLSPIAKPAAPDPVDHSGLWLSRGEGMFVVSHVSVGGPAERANLQAGDRVLAIDGRPTAMLDLPALRQRWAEHGPGLEAVLTVMTEHGPRERRLVITDRFAEASSAQRPR